MSKEVIQMVRKEGKKVYRDLNRELYLNKAGLKNKTDITEIFKSNRDLLETEIIHSLRDSTETDIEDKKSTQLILSFLSEAILLSNSSQIEDGILDIEASSIFSIGESRVPFRKYRSALLKKSKKQEFEDINKKREAILLKLNQLYLRQYAYKQKDSHDLGYSSYLNLYELTENHNSMDLVEKAKEFIRDTEYISREMISWFFLKRMDIELKNASVNDMFYLLNSFELKESFPRLNSHSLAQALLDETGILLPAKIMFDTEKRKGHVNGSIAHIHDPGIEILISTNLQRNIFDYESFLESFGKSLCYGFTNRDDYFEFTDLREKSFPKIFSTLFKNFIFEPEWLKKQFRLEINNDFMKFLYLRKLFQSRILSARVIYEVGLYQRHDDKAEMYREMFQIATHCKPNTHDYLYDIQPHLSSLDNLKATIFETQLRNFMVDKYDEQWWREEEANEFLTKIWETGGRYFSNDLSEKCGFGDMKSANLLQSFEEVLG